MAAEREEIDTVLLVDDEEPVRRTFQEWLSGASLGCRVLTAADAEAALLQANRHAIDLAVLDWNLGAGTDGLQLLEDLTQFSPDIVAILVTGFAHQATPLQAMRMGVRDYLDKNQDLNRDTFLRAVRRQLDRIRPAKRVRRLHRQLRDFRAAVEKVLPLIETTAALREPVPVPEAVRGLFRLLRRETHAAAGVLLARGFDPVRSVETCRAFTDQGKLVEGDLVPFARSLAGSVVGMEQPCRVDDLRRAASEGTLELQPFEHGHTTFLGVPLVVGLGLHVVLELFDRQADGRVVPFTAEDQRLAAEIGSFGAELLRHALAERQTTQVLLDAVAAALAESETVVRSLEPAPGPAPETRPEDPPPEAVLDRLRAGLTGEAVGGADAVRLAEAVRVLAVRHGPRAVRYCIDLVERMRTLLDEATGAAEGQS
jgi:ActR/RegA family two-component response regulator